MEGPDGRELGLQFGYPVGKLGDFKNLSLGLDGNEAHPQQVYQQSPEAAERNGRQGYERCCLVMQGFALCAGLQRERARLPGSPKEKYSGGKDERKIFFIHEPISKLGFFDE